MFRLPRFPKPSAAQARRSGSHPPAGVNATHGAEAPLAGLDPAEFANNHQQLHEEALRRISRSIPPHVRRLME